MTEKRLFTVPDVATLIAKATGQSKFNVAKSIDVAAWTHYAKPGHGKPLEVYSDNGRRTQYMPGLYGCTLDPKITDPLEERRIFTDYVPYLHLRVDLIEVLDALEYHPEIQAKILAERDKPVPAGDDAKVSDTVPDSEPMPYKGGTATLWTAERIAEARTMQNTLKAEGNKAFARLTADHYGITTTRLRAVFKKEASVIEPKQQKKAGPWDVLET